MAREKSDRGREAKKDFPSVTLVSCPIRLSYPHLFDPEKNDQGQDVWEAEALIPPDRGGPKFKRELEDTLHQVMEEYFGPEDEWPRGRNDYHPADKIKFLDPDKLPGKGVTEDWSKFTARSYQPVGVVDFECNEVLSKREVYGGRWARLSLTITVYDNKSKGPTIYLNHVQLLDNDETFGGRGSATAAFGKYDGPELADTDRRDRSGSRDREDAGSRGDRGRGDRDRPSGRDSGRGADREEGRSRRDDRGSDRDRAGDRGGSRRDDEGSSRRDARDGDGSGRDRGVDRDRGGSRDRGDERDSRDGGRGSSRADDRRGGRDEDRGSDRDRGRGGSRDDRDEDSRENRASSRDDRDRDEADDRRPSRGGRDEARDDRDVWN